jgi:hypothetical protein
VLALVASFQPAAGGGLGQGPGAANPEGGHTADEPGGVPEEAPGSVAEAVVRRLPAWARLAIGLAGAWEQVRAEELERAGQPEADPGRREASPPTREPGGSRRPGGAGALAEPSEEAESPAASARIPTPRGGTPRQTSATEVIDSSLESLSDEADDAWWPTRGATRSGQEPATSRHGRLVAPIASATALVAGVSIAWKLCVVRLPRRLVTRMRGGPASA